MLGWPTDRSTQSSPGQAFKQQHDEHVELSFNVLTTLSNVINVILTAVTLCKILLHNPNFGAHNSPILGGD